MFNDNLEGALLLDAIFDRGLADLPFDSKLKLKNKRPTPMLNLILNEKKQKRTFQKSWYKKFEWLTGHSEKNKLFCYICLLFGGGEQKTWSQEGIDNIKNFDKKALKHQVSKRHILNRESFTLLGKGQRIEFALSEAVRLAAIKYNEQVTRNRKIMSRLIQAVLFLSKQELPFRGHREDEGSSNRGNYLELLDYTAQEEQLIRDHLNSASAFRGTNIFLFVK